jgi:hypothetical protein
MVERLKQAMTVVRFPRRAKVHNDLRRPFVMGPERRKVHEQALRNAVPYAPQHRRRAS